MHVRLAQLGGRTGIRALKAVLLASVLVGSIGLAEADTLTDAFVKAYQTNPQLAAQRAALRATDEDVSKAIAAWRPSVTVNADYSKVKIDSKQDPDPKLTGINQEPWQATASVEQVLFAGGRILAQRRQADARVAQGRALLHQTEQGVFIQTVTAYMDVVRDEAVLKLNEQNVALLKRQLEASRARFEVGEITRTDTAQSEAALARGESQLIAAQASLKASRLAYEHVVGEAPGTLVSPTEAPPMPDSEDSARALGDQLNPDLIAARENEHATGHAIDFAVGQLLPTVSLQASYQRNGQEEVPQAIGNRAAVTGVVTWPLYQGGAEWANIRQAKELNSQARLTVLDVQRAVFEGVSNAWESLRAARALSVANASQVKAQQLAFEGVQQELEVGSRTTLDVLNEQQTLLNAQVALVRSQHDEVVAGYQLLASVGKLTAKELGLPVTLYDPTENYEMQTWRPFGAATYED
jgi:TolC family type I secretion outer membrane protein